MRFILWKWWLWLPIGICFGAALAFFYGEVSPPAGAGRVSFDDFADAIQTPNAITQISIYPPHEQVYLVTFQLAGNGKSASSYLLAKTPLTVPFIAKKPKPSNGFLDFLTSSAKPPAQADQTIRDKTIIDYLQRLRITHPQISYSYLWWTTDNWRYASFSAIGAILIGGFWPLVLKKLVKAGYGPPQSEEPKYDLKKFSSEPPAKPAATGPSQEDINRLKELDAELERQLAAGVSTETATAVAGAQPVAAQPLRTLNSTPLEAPTAQTKEEKDYRGEFYPTVRGPQSKRSGFSLVELLVVIGIIALLVSILLPTLSKAKQSAMTLTCANNLRNIGQALGSYLVEFQGTYPASYLYIGHSIIDGVQTPTTIDFGYVHWSSYLYGAGKIPETAFQCPAMNRGGLPPTNTTPDNIDPGQNLQASGVVDHQAIRLAYTLNEALCPRNKFVVGFQGAKRIYRFVKASQVANASGTILATEWLDNGLIIGRDTGNTGWMMSHRPVNGFIASNGTIDIFTLDEGAGFRRATAADLDPDPLSATTTQTHLDWVGRNHGQKRTYPDQRKTNFLYVDGHVVTKSIYETLSPFEWGEKFYSLVPNDDFVGP